MSEIDDVTNRLQLSIHGSLELLEHLESVHANWLETLASVREMAEGLLNNPERTVTEIEEITQSIVNELDGLR